MKKLYFLIIFGSLLLHSCKNDTTENNNEITSENLEIESKNDTLKIIFNEFEKDTPELQFTVKCQLFEKEDSLFAKLVNDLILKDFSSSFSDQVIKSKNKDSVFSSSYKQYLKEVKEYYSEYDYEFKPQFYRLYNYEIDNSLENFVSIYMGFETYEGGAHGNRYIKYKNVNKKGKPHTLKLEDIVTDKTKLTNIAKKYFVKEFEGKSGEKFDISIFWFPNNKFELNENFKISKNKISFIFNTYEYAPYAYGEFFFEIPLKEISDILKVEIK